MSKISRFTKKAVQLAKNAVSERDEVAAPEGGGGFAEYAVVSLHCLRVYLEKSYRVALDLLSEMPQILGEIGRIKADLPDHSTLVKGFDRIKTALWRVLLRLSAQLHEPSGHAAIDATFFDRENASKLYCRRTNHGFRRSKRQLSSTQKPKPFWTFTVQLRNATTRSEAGEVARNNAGDLASLAADKGYDWTDLRDKLREEGVRPLIKHREFRPIDHAHNALIDGIDTANERCVKPSSRRSSTCISRRRKRGTAISGYRSSAGTRKICVCYWLMRTIRGATDSIEEIVA